MALPMPTAHSRAVVTGASSGIGMAFARELATRGYNLVLVARREQILNELADELRSRTGVEVDVRACDLSKPGKRAPLLAELENTEVSILCNNAGIATFGPVSGLDFDYERDQVQLNAVAAHELILAVLPGMLERRSGGILNVGSAAGNMAIPGNATYGVPQHVLGVAARGGQEAGRERDFARPGTGAHRRDRRGRQDFCRPDRARQLLGRYDVHRAAVDRCARAQQDAGGAWTYRADDVAGHELFASPFGVAACGQGLRQARRGLGGCGEFCRRGQLGFDARLPRVGQVCGAISVFGAGHQSKACPSKIHRGLLKSRSTRQNTRPAGFE